MVEKCFSVIRIYSPGYGQSVQRTPEMRIMVDIVTAFFTGPRRIDKISDRKQYAGYNKIDHQPGIVIDHDEDNARYAARSTERQVITIVPVFQERRQRRNDNTGDINEREQDAFIQLQQNHFHRPAKKEQGEHVEEQVLVIGMDKPRSDQAVIFRARMHAPGPEDKPVVKSMIAESGNRNDRSYNDNDQRVVHNTGLRY